MRLYTYYPLSKNNKTKQNKKQKTKNKKQNKKPHRGKIIFLLLLLQVSENTFQT